MEILLGLAKRCHLIPLKGNHELLILRALDDPGQMMFWLQSGGLATLPESAAATTSMRSCN